jgi:hypothetical protein
MKYQFYISPPKAIMEGLKQRRWVLKGLIEYICKERGMRMNITLMCAQ